MHIIIFAIIFNFLSPQQENVKDKIETYFNKTEYKDVSHIILAMSVLESAWWKNKRHIEFNNYFSIKDFNKETQHKLCKTKPIYCMKKYKNIDDGIEDAYYYFATHNYPLDVKGFFNRLNGIGGLKYAEDPKYISKLKSVIRSIKRINNQ